MGSNREEKKKGGESFWRRLFKSKGDEYPESQIPPTTSEIIQPAVPYLESLHKVDEPKRLLLERRTTRIGRALDNDLVINETFVGWETVSRYHADVRLEKDRWVLVDSGSQNGVFVNGRRTGRNILCDGYRVSLGSAEFLFRTGENSGPDEAPQTQGGGEA